MSCNTYLFYCMNFINSVTVTYKLINVLLQDANHSLCLSDLSLISTDSELRENFNNVSACQISQFYKAKNEIRASKNTDKFTLYFSFLLFTIRFRFVTYFTMHLLQSQNLDLNNITPVKIFELMLQSPENNISQDDPHSSGKNLLN